MTKKKTQRLTLDLGQQSWNRLATLQEIMEQGTKTGVIQSALQLLEYVVDRTQSGDVFLVQDDSGKLERLQILGLAPKRLTEEAT